MLNRARVSRVAVLCLSACSLLLAPSSGYAIVTADDTTSATDPTGLDWSGVYNYKTARPSKSLPIGS